MIKILLSTFLIIAISQYSRIDAVRYARENVYNIAHTCGYLSDSYLKCTPFAYFGKDYCGYNGKGDDSANYVSQCLVYGGGHEYLNDEEHCRGYPCGFEEPEAINLGFCLQEKGWNSTCGKLLPPPSYIEPGDVLIYHEKGCDLNLSHAVIISEVGENVKVIGRSESMVDEIYSYNTEKPYYQWLHYIDPEEYIFKIEKIKIGFSPCGDSIGEYSFYIYGEFNKEVDISETLNLNLTTSFDIYVEKYNSTVNVSASSVRTGNPVIVNVNASGNTAKDSIPFAIILAGRKNVINNNGNAFLNGTPLIFTNKVIIDISTLSADTDQ